MRELNKSIQTTWGSSFVTCENSKFLRLITTCLFWLLKQNALGVHPHYVERGLPSYPGPGVLARPQANASIESKQDPAGPSQGQTPPPPPPTCPASCLKKSFSLLGLLWVPKHKLNQTSEKMQQQLRKRVKQDKIIVVIRSLSNQGPLVPLQRL